MSYKEAINRLDELMTCADFGIKNLMVVQTALSEKAVGAAEGGDALFATCEYLRDLHDQMQKIVSQAMAANRMEACA